MGADIISHVSASPLHEHHTALIDHVSELATQPGFVAKLHASADKAHNQQPQRGRPPKASSAAAVDLKSVQLNGGAHAAAV